MIDLKTLRQLRKFRRMYLPDDHFITLVAFISGTDVMNGFKVQHEFKEWLARLLPSTPSITWDGQLIGQRHPGSEQAHEVDPRRPYDWLSPEQEAELCEDAFDFLERFLVERQESDGSG